MSAKLTERRIDVLTGRHVIVASERAHRPLHVVPASCSAEPDDDPFGEGHEHDTPSERLALRRIGSAANAAGWLLRVVPNRYPAIQEINGEQISHADADGDKCDLLPEYSATGVHDVVIECADSRSRLIELSVVEVARILLAWQMRLRQLLEIPSIACIDIFRNEGFGAGASLPHSHSQILATDRCGPQAELRFHAAKAFQRERQASLYREWLKAETLDGRRVVQTTQTLALICPFASRVPWQVRVGPADASLHRFDGLSERQLTEVAAAILSAAKALDQFAGSVAHNLNLTLPPAGALDAFPWMLDLLPRPHRFAGFELMTDVDILTVAPETAAHQYRTAMEELLIPSHVSLCPEGFVWMAGDNLGQ